MAAPTLEINAGGQLEITEGTSGDPVTWNDVWDWDDGGGSSGGDGDIPIDGGGTAKVNTYITEIVADAVYLILGSVFIGDGSTSTYFVSVGEMVYFVDDIHFQTVTAATTVIGEITSGEVTNASMWSWNPLSSGVATRMVNGGAIFLYGTTIINRGTGNFFFQAGEATLNRVTFIGGGAFYWRCPVTANDVLISDLSYFILSFIPVEFTRVHLNSLGNYMGVESDSVTNGLKITNPSGDALSISSNISLDAVDNDPTGPLDIADVAMGSGTGEYNEIYTCNIHVTDKDGADLEGVTILCEDEADATVFSVSTDAGGDIAEQQITYKRKTNDGGTVITTFSPHKFTYTVGGIGFEMENVTVDSPIVWRIEFPSTIDALDEINNRLKRIGMTN